MPDQKTNIRKTFNYLIRGVIILVTYGFIYRQVFVEKKLQDIPGIYNRIMEMENIRLMSALILFLMLLNWGLESLKWQILIGKIEKISFFRSFKAVMTGVSVSLFTPNRTGDYLGRVFILEKGNHIEGILITLIGSFAQVIITVCAGLFAVLSFLGHYPLGNYHMPDFLLYGLILLIPAIVFLIILFYFNINLVSELLRRFLPGKWEKWADYTRVFSLYNTKELLWNLLLSLARYLVFSTQFFLLLRIFGAALPVSQAFILIPVIYLVMAIIPTIALADLGIRGTVSMFIIGLYFEKAGTGNPDIGFAILTASSLLWFVNLIIPAVMGTFFVFSLKFFRK
jgi:uncharacterized membrane protein YbhN (UPF0104 family)